MTERAPVKPGTAVEERLFSRTYAAATISFAAVMFLTGFAALAVVPTLPAAARELDGVHLYPLVAGCFVAASLLGGVLGGDWADRAGPAGPLAAGVVLAVVTLVVSASSTTIWQLAAGRFLDGVAAGMIAVAINTAIAHAYPDRLRARALALMSTCWIIPSLTGPPLAGLVADRWSWRVVFYGLAALTVIPSLAVVFLLRSRSLRAAPADRAPEAPHGPGAAPRAAGRRRGERGRGAGAVRRLGLGCAPSAVRGGGCGAAGGLHAPAAAAGHLARRTRAARRRAAAWSDVGGVLHAGGLRAAAAGHRPARAAGADGAGVHRRRHRLGGRLLAAGTAPGAGLPAPHGLRRFAGDGRGGRDRGGRDASRDARAHRRRGHGVRGHRHGHGRPVPHPALAQPQPAG